MVWYRSLPTEGVRRSLAAIFTRPARESVSFASRCLEALANFAWLCRL
jgi:hypothetical protein